ncbi:MAG: chromate transporter [Peptococcaceae bacterium]|jgi:chromate transporter|nr:chromate transporter [Peptococcaceae bacterium]
MKTLWDLFIAFFRASNLSFGGGPAMIPLIRAEVVDKYQWLSNEEFANLLAIGNILPAPISTKLAGTIGYKVKGWLGAVSAVLGTVILTVLIIVFFGNLLNQYADNETVKAMLKGVRPVVVILLVQAAYEMGRKSFNTKAVLPWIFGVVTLLLMILWQGQHSVYLIMAGMVLGYFLFKNKV